MRFRHTDPQGNGLSRRNSEGLRAVPRKGLGGQKESTGISPRKDWVINLAFHTQIVGLGKDWQCEGWNHSNFFSFWSHPVGEMSYVLMKCHPSIRGLSSASVSVFSTVLGIMRGGQEEMWLLTSGSLHITDTPELISWKNPVGNLAFLASSFRVEGANPE